MADRDLVFTFLTKTDRFELDRPADQLEQLARAADDTGERLEQLERVDGSGLERLGRSAETSRRDLDELEQAADDAGEQLEQLDRVDADGLDRIGDDARRAGDGLDELGDEARQAAARVDDAMDDMATSSRSSMSRLDDALDRGRAGMDEFKDEAGQSGREAAASFSGEFSDVGDFIQETLANGLTGLGPIGAAAGVAMAAGFGVFVTQLQETNERVEILRDALVDVQFEGLDDAAARIDALNDAARDADVLDDYARALRDTGISARDFARARAGDADAYARVSAQLESMSSWMGRVPWDAQAAGAHDLTKALHESNLAMTEANELAPILAELSAEGAAAQQAQAEAAEEAAAAQRDYADAASESIAAIADATPALTALVQEHAQAQADATKDPKDAWADYADTVKLSAADIVAVLDEQTAAAENWRANLLEVQKTGDAEFLAWVSEQPANVAAAYAAGTAGERQSIYDAFYRNVGASMGEGIGAGLASQQPAIGSRSAELHDEVRRRMSNRVHVPVGVTGPSQAELAGVRAGITRGLSGIQVGVTAIAQTVLGRTYP